MDGHVLLVGTLAGTHVDPSTVARTDGDRSGTEGVGTERARTERAQTERARTEHGGPDGAHRVAPYLVRLRELSADLTTWSDLPEGEVVGSGPVAADGLLVWPSPQRQDGGEVDGWGRSYPEGGIYDPTTHSWHTLPDEYRARCDGSPTGAESTAVGPWVLGWGWATAAVLVIGLGLGLVRQQAWDADYRTGLGEQRRIELADGSHLLLDSDSAVDVSLRGDLREIVLRRGEALFEVAHDPQRPFRVEAGDLSATALGTVYAVRRQDDVVRVTVAQGRVAVQGEGEGLTLAAGEQVAARGGRLQARQAVDAGKVLAWQHGRLVFEMTPLAEVLAELQRYRPGYLLIADDRLRDLKVNGSFRLDRLDDALATLEQAFALSIRRYTDYVLVLQAR